jgi:D-arabinose 1-dehydrogenase-like Zn-dependent alcohol dehydrogenase
MDERSSIDTYAAMGEGQALRRFSYPSNDIGPLEVKIAIPHCGICHFDLHLIDNDWGVSAYPLVPGQEIVGTVTQVGSEVANIEHR